MWTRLHHQQGHQQLLMHQLSMQMQLLQMQRSLRQLQKLQQHRRQEKPQQPHPATKSSSGSQMTVTIWRMRRQQSDSTL
jgi:hypothetical protein